MDHYCPWFSTIGFHNYKFFIQFLSYVAIYCWFYLLLVVKYYIILLPRGYLKMKSYHLI